MTNSPGVMTSPTITASVLTDDLAFEALASEWDELLDQKNQRSFFLRPSWTRLWWRTFRPLHSHLFIIACRDSEGRLAGLAPLYWKQRRTAGVPHLRELQFLGTGIYAQTSEYLDVIARRGYEQVVAETVADFLRRDPDWDRLCLSDVPADSPVLPFLRRAFGDDAQITGCNRSFYIDTSADWDTFKSRLSKSARENIFRRQRRLFETFQCEFRLVENTCELEQAMDDLVRLHQARWQTKGEPGTFALDGSEDLLREAARISLAEGRLRLWTLTMDKEVTAVLLGFVDNGILHAFQSGFDPAYTHKGLGSVMNGLCIRACVEDETIRDYDFMGGSDAYKQSWTKTSWDSVALTCMRPGLHSQTFKAIEHTTRAAKSIVRGTVPKSIRRAAYKFILLRRYYSNKPIADNPTAVLSGLSLLRCFIGERIPTLVISADPDDVTFKSKYCRQKRLIANPVSAPANAVRDLEELGKSFAEKAVLYYGDDPTLLLISRNRERLEKYYRFQLPEPEMVEQMVDKTLFAGLAESRDLPVPKTVTSIQAPTAEAALEILSLPCIVKPNLRDGWYECEAVMNRGGTPLKALRANTAEELDSLYRSVGQFTNDFVVQEYVPGGDDCIYSFHAYYDSHSEPIAWYVGRKIRTYPKESGASTYLELVKEPEVAELGMEILKKLKFVGPVKIDFKKDPVRNRYYLLEINARFNLWNYLGTASGINLPLVAYRDLTGQPCERQTNYRTGVRWLAFGDDLRSFVRHYRPAGDLTWMGWLKSYGSKKVYQVFAWRDPYPFLLSLSRYSRAFYRKLGKGVVK